jgi:DnaJ like chaperone protein
MSAKSFNIPRHWWGKIIGGLIGLFRGGITGAVIGALLGHLVDRFLAGAWERSPRPTDRSRRPRSRWSSR